jgi:glucosamine 6-phosphate synthetase-like amidotransferase/phosphosugar isomerase protein
MCGISGFVNLGMTNEQCKLLAETLLTELESRGTDSTGIYTNGWVIKAPFKATNFVDFLPDEYGKLTLLHNRWWTSGEPKDNNNNHPIFSDNWVLVHNGVIEMDRLATYSYKGKVDSEVLLSYIEKEGLVPAIKKIQGTAAIAAIDKRESCIYLWRNTNPIALGLVPRKVLMFASETDAIFNAADAVFGSVQKRFSKALVVHTAVDTLMRLSDKGRVKDVCKVQAKSNYKPYKYTSSKETKTTKFSEYEDYGQDGYGKTWSPEEQTKTSVTQEKKIRNNSSSPTNQTTPIETAIKNTIKDTTKSAIESIIGEEV